ASCAPRSHMREIELLVEAYLLAERSVGRFREQHPHVRRASRTQRVGDPLIPPKVLEPCRRQFRISNRVADIPMPKVILNGSRIVAIARELVSRTVSQHVRMNLKGQSRLLTRALHQPIESIG